MIVIKANSGLCNKLRTVFSYWEYAKLNKKKLTVIWEESNACPGFFLDYFEPIDGITFLDKDPGNLEIDYTGNLYHPNFSSHATFIYSDLKLRNNLQLNVNEKLNLLGNNFIAIQVRRTDHVKLAKQVNKFTTDEDFFKFIDENPAENLFITADNMESYSLFKGCYPTRVKVDYPKNDPTKPRHTSLEDAIIDMYVSVHSKKFMKSGYSSFGDTIYQLRNFHLLNVV